MTSTSIARALSLLLLSSLVFSNVVGRNIPEFKELHPHWFGHFDHETMLVPGIGRFIKCTDPLVTNPITGEPGGAQVPRFRGATRQSRIPGGDDTFVPNPGFEVPVAAGGGNHLVPTAP